MIWNANFLPDKEANNNQKYDLKKNNERMRVKK